MKGILEEIVRFKKKEVELAKKSFDIRALKVSPIYSRQPFSMIEAIIHGSGVIAEFKRASPSKGWISEDANVQVITSSYKENGASGISVLTDNKFFRAHADDLELTREIVDIPILRKDFIVDAYQLHQAKALGADCVLLIVAFLDKASLKMLYDQAMDLGLDVLVEIHHEEELEKLSGDEGLVGVNNRNLETFKVDINNSVNLAAQLGDIVKIAESGLGHDSNIRELLLAGFDGFLVGESFMKTNDPGLACKRFINEVERKK